MKGAFFPTLIFCAISLQMISCSSSYSVSSPLFSRASGYFTEPFDLVLTIDSGYTAYYTLDGSVPDPSHVGAVPNTDADGNTYSSVTYIYSAPISIRDRTSDPNGISMIPTSNIPNYYDITAPSWYGSDWKAPLGLVPKGTVVRVQLYKGTIAVSPVETRSWIAPPSSVSGLPVISLSTDSANLFDYDKGILVPGRGYDYSEPASTFYGIAYGNYSFSGPYYERPIHMEFFPNDGSDGFSVDMGVRVGGQARGQPYHAMDFYLRSEYGKSWLEYNLLGNDINRYKRFKLRGGGSTWFYTFFNDAWGQELVSDSGLDVQDFRPTIVYINGEFWGVFNLRDTFNDNYLMTKFGLSSTDIENNVDLFINTEYDLGDSLHYDALIAFLKTASSDGTEALSTTDFAAASAMVDLVNLARYQASISVLGSQIYPNNHNDKRWRTRTVKSDNGISDGRWRWVVIDCDAAFMGQTMSVWDNVDGLLPYLEETPSFVNLYLASVQGYLNTVLEPSFTTKYLTDNIQKARPWMVEMNKRWQYPDIARYDSYWIDYIENARRTASRVRTDCESRFSVVSVPVEFQRIGAGTVMVDWVGIGKTAKVYGYIGFPWTGEYFSTVPIPLVAEAQDGYHFDHWETDGDISIASTTSASSSFTPGTSGGTVRAVFIAGDK